MLHKPQLHDVPGRWSPWRAFARHVLFDYPPRARAVWLCITGAGLAALLWASWQLVSMPGASAWPLALALGLVALALLAALGLGLLLALVSRGPRRPA